MYQVEKYDEVTEWAVDSQHPAEADARTRADYLYDQEGLLSRVKDPLGSVIYERSN